MTNLWEVSNISVDMESMHVSQTCTKRHLVSTTADMLLSSVEDLYRQTSRTKLIGKLVLDRKELIFQHLQDYTAERARQLNEGLAAEAVRMRVITIVTLIYLPATFTSVSIRSGLCYQQC
jgi:hypothetical protein